MSPTLLKGKTKAFFLLWVYNVCPETLSALLSSVLLKNIPFIRLMRRDERDEKGCVYIPSIKADLACHRSSLCGYD